MLDAPLVPVKADPWLAQVHHAQFQRAVADFPGAELTLSHVALILLVDPKQLVLPVFVIEAVEVVEKVDLPTCGFFGGLHTGGDQYRKSIQKDG